MANPFLGILRRGGRRPVNPYAGPLLQWHKCRQCGRYKETIRPARPDKYRCADCQAGRGVRSGPQ